MPVVSRPIPPLYAVYILRSRIKPSSLYIGSTPNPPRRLKQHNGWVKGGARRTAQRNRRPWEMVALVSGFPSMVAALKFEWALNNPHVSLHIPASSRITVSTQWKKSGQPKRPIHTLTRIIMNLHLLLRVPSFGRWPLKLHFFTTEVLQEWQKWCTSVNEPLRKTIDIVTDFNPALDEDIVKNKPEELDRPWGIHALSLDYAPMKDYVKKTDSIFTFEREGRCVVCKKKQEPGKGLYVACPNELCQGVGHLKCWSKYLLGNDTKEEIIPVAGNCPRCHEPVSWGDMMKELSLRVRGEKEVQKLLKESKK